LKNFTFIGLNSVGLNVHSSPWNTNSGLSDCTFHEMHQPEIWWMNLFRPTTIFA